MQPEKQTSAVGNRIKKFRDKAVREKTVVSWRCTQKLYRAHTAPETMESVGQKLRLARLRQGLTLEDVSATTRINLKNLNAIEDDDVARLGSRFLYRSFARQFAATVAVEGVDFESMLDATAQGLPPPLIPGQPGAPTPPNVPGLRPEPVRFSRWVYSFSSLIVMLVACSIISAIWESSRSRLFDSVSSLTHAIQNTMSSSDMTHSPVAAVEHRRPATSGLQTGNAPAPASDAEISDGFRIQLWAIEQTWLSVMTDGKEVYRGTLQADESKILEGHEMARIRTGNAGGVDVIFNGKAIGALGSRGQVRTVVFSKNGYEIVEPEAHIALAHFIPNGE